MNDLALSTAVKEETEQFISMAFEAIHTLQRDKRNLRKHNRDLAEERDELWKKCGELERENADLRRELYFQIQELLHREVPVIFLYWGKEYPAITSKLGGFWPSAFNRLLWNVKDWYLVE